MMRVGDDVIFLRAGEGIEIAPSIEPQFCNESDSDVEFIVIASADTRQVRLNV